MTNSLGQSNSARKTRELFSVHCLTVTARIEALSVSALRLCDIFSERKGEIRHLPQKSSALFAELFCTPNGVYKCAVVIRYAIISYAL